MTSFSRGTNAPGQCARCGFVYRLRELQYQVEAGKVTTLRVCPDCLDADHPQLMLGRLRVSDPQTIRDPAPLNEIDLVGSDGATLDVDFVLDGSLLASDA